MKADLNKTDLIKAHRAERANFVKHAKRYLDGYDASSSRNKDGDVVARLANGSDIPSLVQLNQNAVDRLGHDGLFMRQQSDFFTRVLAAGAVIVLERKATVLGYSVAVLGGADFPLFVPVHDSRRIGLLFGSALASDLCGNGWQKWFIDVRLHSFQESGYLDVQSTVSPFNVPSLLNLVDRGFRIIGLKGLLDGHPRFLLSSHIGERVAKPVHRLPSVDLEVVDDLSEHRNILKQDYQGTRVLTDSGRIFVRYVKAEY